VKRSRERSPRPPLAEKPPFGQALASSARAFGEARKLDAGDLKAARGDGIALLNLGARRRRRRAPGCARARSRRQPRPLRAREVFFKSEHFTGAARFWSQVLAQDPKLAQQMESRASSGLRSKHSRESRAHARMKHERAVESGNGRVNRRADRGAARRRTQPSRHSPQHSVEGRRDSGSKRRWRSRPVIERLLTRSVAHSGRGSDCCSSHVDPLGQKTATLSQSCWHQRRLPEDRLSRCPWNTDRGSSEPSSS